MRVFAVGLALAQGSAGATPGPCPEGMVMVAGKGSIGMRGQPYGLVPTAHLEVVDAPEKGCDAAVRGTPGASTCWVQTDLVDPVLPPRDVELAPFCIDAHPFPGSGHAYTTDGLNAWSAKQFQNMLATGSFGRRRFCTATEFQAAVAGLGSNRRFIYGDRYQPGRCDGPIIGADPLCGNPETGTFEYGAIHSHWVVADKGFVDFACASTGCNAAGNRRLQPGMLIVMGGTSRFQTRQAPLTPHTWHDHGDATPEACGFQGWDDQPAICADPGTPDPVGQANWNRFIQLVTGNHRVDVALSKWLSTPVCQEN